MKIAISKEGIKLESIANASQAWTFKSLEDSLFIANGLGKDKKINASEQKGVEPESHNPESRENSGHTGEELVIDLKSDGESRGLWRRSGARLHGSGRGTPLYENYNKASVSIK